VKYFWPYLYGRAFRLRTDHASLIWLCKRAEPASQVARWLEILAEFPYRIEHRAGKKHGNADGMSRRPEKACKQCLHIEERDGGPARLDVERQLGDNDVYSWERGQLRSEHPPDTKNALRANPTLYQNVKELSRLQQTLPGAVADIFRPRRRAADLPRNSSNKGMSSTDTSVFAGVPSRSTRTASSPLHSQQTTAVRGNASYAHVPSGEK